MSQPPTIYSVCKKLFNDDSDLYEPSYNFKSEKQFIESIQTLQQQLQQYLEQSNNSNRSIIVDCILEPHKYIIPIFPNLDQFIQDYYTYFKSDIQLITYVIDYTLLKSIIISQLDNKYTYTINILQAIYNTTPHYINRFRNKLIRELPFHMSRNLFENKYLYYTNTTDIVTDLCYYQMNYTYTKQVLDIIKGSYNPKELITEITSIHIITNINFHIRFIINSNTFYNNNINIVKTVKDSCNQFLNLINIIAYVIYDYNIEYITLEEFINMLPSNFMNFYKKLHIGTQTIIDILLGMYYGHIKEHIKEKKNIHIISNQWCESMYNPKYLFCKYRLIKNMIDSDIELNPVLVELVKKRESLPSGKERFQLWQQIVPLIKQEFIY